MKGLERSVRAGILSCGVLWELEHLGIWDVCSGERERDAGGLKEDLCKVLKLFLYDPFQ